MSQTCLAAHHHQYVNPGETKVTVGIRESPRALISTISDRLLGKPEQAASFESLPVFNQLIYHMTTHIDHTPTEHDVTQYYRYAMFLHKLEDNEPLFEKVMRIIVYDIEESLSHDKL
jgi:hypothetical protein